MLEGIHTKNHWIFKVWTCQLKKSSSTDLNLSLNHRTSLSEFGIYLKYRTL
jgi:hypothetical protein